MLGLYVTEYPTKDLDKRADKLVNYLWGRHPPLEAGGCQQKAAAVEKEVLAKGYTRTRTMLQILFFSPNTLSRRYYTLSFLTILSVIMHCHLGCYREC